jgi:hypothetical protein
LPRETITESIAEVAYHEAGHAVIAALLESSIVRVTIQRTAGEGQWDGATERLPKQVEFEGQEGGRLFVDPSGPLNEIAVAWAGCLAQARFVALRGAEPTSFSREQDWQSLFAWMNDRSPETQEPYPLRFTDNKAGALQVEIRPRWFGGKDRSVFLASFNTLNQHPLIRPQLMRLLRETLVETMDGLETGWDTVARVADALIGKCDGTAASLSSKEFQELLQS